MQTDEEEEPAEDKRDYAPSASALTEPVTRSKHHYKAGNDQPISSSSAAGRWRSWWEIVRDVLVLATAMVGTYSLVDQTRETRRATDLSAQAIAEARNANDMTKEAQSRADADATEQRARLVAQDARAERQIALSGETIRQSRDAFRLEQRAWVTVQSAQLIRNLAAGEAPAVIMRIVNSGRTPALDVVFAGQTVFYRGQLKMDLAGELRTERPPSMALLGRGPSSRPLPVAAMPC